MNVIFINGKRYDLSNVDLAIAQFTAMHHGISLEQAVIAVIPKTHKTFTVEG